MVAKSIATNLHFIHKSTDYNVYHVDYGVMVG